LHLGSPLGRAVQRSNPDLLKLLARPADFRAVSTRVVNQPLGPMREAPAAPELPSSPPMLEDALAILAMVRETVATINGEEAALHEALTGSADRFESLARVNDFRRLQTLLFEEVRALKRVTMARRTAWNRTLEEFGERVTTLERHVDHMRQEAALDPLTGVGNRRTFERTCREWLERDRRFAMAIVDVDNFKTINDGLGHGAGDRVLVTIARTLARSLRPGDLVARLGGDEFVILAADLSVHEAEQRFEAIGQDVSDACATLAEDGVAASISVGIAERLPSDTVDGLHHRADAALYQAKRNGKGCVASRAGAFVRDRRKPGQFEARHFRPI
jgi:diguanylate cyclase (GGDEF)-like protein